MHTSSLHPSLLWHCPYLLAGSPHLNNSFSLSDFKALCCSFVMLALGGLALLRILHTLTLSSLASLSGIFLAPSSTAAAISMYGIFRGAGGKLRPRFSAPFSSVVNSYLERFTHADLSMLALCSILLLDDSLNLSSLLTCQSFVSWKVFPAALLYMSVTRLKSSGVIQHLRFRSSHRVSSSKRSFWQEDHQIRSRRQNRLDRSANWYPPRVFISSCTLRLSSIEFSFLQQSLKIRWFLSLAILCKVLFIVPRTLLQANYSHFSHTALMNKHCSQGY